MAGRLRPFLRTVALLIVCLVVAPTWAQLETFDNDTDTFEPGDAPGGAPPAADDWRDGRNGGDGLIEEVASPFGGVSAGSGGGTNFGVIYPGPFQPAPVYSAGPSGTPSYSQTPLSGAWSYQTDIYTDPSFTSNQNSVPDFWWTNAINRNGTDEYLTETGITGEVRSNGEWRFTTTLGGQPFVDLAAGAWYSLEVEYELVGDEVHAHHRIFNQSHTMELYNYTLESLFQSPTAEDVGGPRYSWFTYFEENIDHLSVDNLGVDEPVAAGASSGIAGDLNNDGVLNGADEVEFAAALSNLSLTSGTFGDVNGDGVFDNYDIPAFRDLLAASSGSAGAGASAANAVSAVPEPSSVVLALMGLVGIAAGWLRKRG